MATKGGLKQLEKAVLESLKKRARVAALKKRTRPSFKKRNRHA